MLWTYQIISSYRKTYFLNLYINETCKGRFFDNWHIINVVYWMNKFKTEKRNNFWEVKKLSKFFWQKATFRTNLRWRFCKILWPSQNIWTLLWTNLARHKLHLNYCCFFIFSLFYFCISVFLLRSGKNWGRCSYILRRPQNFAKSPP